MTTQTLKPCRWREFTRNLLLLGAGASLLFLFYAVLTGFPLELFGHTLKLKNLKTPFLILCVFLAARAALSPEGPKQGILELKRRIHSVANSSLGLWAMLLFSALLLTWQQITEYLSLEINFIPFGYYDYMLHYFFQGKINFTNELHGFYHLNNVLYLLAPAWKMAPNSLLLILVYGPLASLSAWPLYEIARHELKSRALAFLTAFIYLNYRYLQNAMEVNFSIEIFYPLFIFSAFLAALKGRWGYYYLAVLAGLSVKEDSCLYFSALAGLLFFWKMPEDRRPWELKLHALLTVALSGLYALFLLKLFIPWTGNDIFHKDMENFSAHGETHQGILSGFLTNPAKIWDLFFGSGPKIKTYIRLFSRLAFVPLATPAVIWILIPLAPLFMHSDPPSNHFVDLRLYYSLTVLPFLFIAFVAGLHRICRLEQNRLKNFLLGGFCLALIGMNGGHYRTEKWTREDLKSISWARSVPAGANLVTHGHLLPYVGYRPYNYYFAEPWELAEHPMHGSFMNADYYLIDRNVNFYPMDENYIARKIDALKADPRYEILKQDGVRVLFHKKS